MSLQLFDFQNHNVRVVMREGAAHFVASDVCAALDLGNVSQAVSRLDDDEVFLLQDGGKQFNVLTEAGLFNLVLSSRKAIAREFKRWVTHEVLPTLLGTGTYSLAPAAAPPVGLDALKHIVHEFERQDGRLQVVEKKVAALPVMGEQLGQIYRLGQKLGVAMGDYGRAWRLFKDRFGLASYRDLPADRYEEAVAFLQLQLQAFGPAPLISGEG